MKRHFVFHQIFSIFWSFRRVVTILMTSLHHYISPKHLHWFYNNYFDQIYWFCSKIALQLLFSQILSKRSIIFIPILYNRSTINPTLCTSTKIPFVRAIGVLYYIVTTQCCLEHIQKSKTFVIVKSSSVVEARNPVQWFG